MSIADLRREYNQGGLREVDAAANPFAQFDRWFSELRQVTQLEANAMTVATATPDGRPSARVVLLKQVDERGFVFYTNYESRKGEELAANSWVTLLFYWPELERQVRIEGQASYVTPEESDSYYNSRPKTSRVGAWVSPQSQVIPDRAFLEQRVVDITAQYPDEQIPRPPNWGGYRVQPITFEFWQGRPSRLHDRLRYSRNDAGLWIIERLAP